jgi:hypothetical protein
MYSDMFGYGELDGQPGGWGRRYLHDFVVQTCRSDDEPENEKQSVQSE